MWNKLLNPWLIFTLLWAIISILIKLKITTNIVNLEGPVWSIIWVNLITSLYLYILFLTVDNQKYKFDPRLFNFQLKIAYNFSQRLIFVWFLLVLIDVIYSKGFPLLWIFTNYDNNYTNLGIPSLRGLQHTLYLFIITVYALCFKYLRLKNRRIVLFFLALYPILMLSRSLMMYALFQIFCTTLFWEKIKFRHVMSISALLISTILLFGLIGDVRGSNENPFAYLIASNYADLMSELPTGFTWVYIYLTANFNNIMTTYGTYDLSYSFGEIFYNIVPGALKDYIFDATSSNASVLITDENLNVASFYASYVSSFGVVGAILGGALLQFISTLFYFLARSGNVGYLIGYSILFSCLIISVFFDALMTISTIAGIVLALILARRIKSKEREYYDLKNY
jgi:oligosaccharide repeat unit polymerase